MTGESNRNLLDLLAVMIGFGCLFGYSRLLIDGFGSVIHLSLPVSEEMLDLARSLPKLLVFIVFTILGLRGTGNLNRYLAFAAGIVLALTSCLRALVALPALIVVIDVVMGLSSGYLLLVWMVAICSLPARRIVATMLGALVMSGVVIGLTRVLPTTGILMTISTAAFVPGLMFLLLDEKTGSIGLDGGFSRDQILAFPWFTVIVIVVIEFIGTLMYGVLEHLRFGAAAPVDRILFGLATLACIITTVFLILRTGSWTATVWIPAFALLVTGILAASMMGATDTARSMALVMAIMFSCHFLRWITLPAIVSHYQVPRVVTCSILLIITNSFLTSQLGIALTYVIPDGLRTLQGITCFMAIVLVIVFAIAVVVGRLIPHDTIAIVQAREEQAVDGHDQPDPAVAFAHALASEYGLTPREREIAVMTSRGYSSTYIAEKLVISSSTVRFHQRNIYTKLGIHSRQELIDRFNTHLEASMGA